jgi:hypothetical protein
LRFRPAIPAILARTIRCTSNVGSRALTLLHPVEWRAIGSWPVVSEYAVIHPSGLLPISPSSDHHRGLDLAESPINTTGLMETDSRYEKAVPLCVCYSWLPAHTSIL